MKAYLFDLDGTILDSMHVWDTIGESFLRMHNIPIPENLQETISTMSFAQSAQYFITLGNLEMSFEEIQEVFYAMVKTRYEEEIMCKPFVKAFLKECKRQNIKTGIVTALDKKLAQTCLKRNEVDTYFDFILTCDEIGKGKDEIDIYVEGAHRLHADPQDVVVFEDALYCMKTAKLAGMYVIGVYDDTQVITKEEKTVYCDRFIESFEVLWKEMSL